LPFDFYKSICFGLLTLFVCKTLLFIKLFFKAIVFNFFNSLDFCQSFLLLPFSLYLGSSFLLYLLCPLSFDPNLLSFLSFYLNDCRLFDLLKIFLDRYSDRLYHSRWWGDRFHLWKTSRWSHWRWHHRWQNYWCLLIRRRMFRINCATSLRQLRHLLIIPVSTAHHPIILRCKHIIFIFIIIVELSSP
jgi:hypothetical protein